MKIKSIIIRFLSFKCYTYLLCSPIPYGRFRHLLPAYRAPDGVGQPLVAPLTDEVSVVALEYHVAASVAGVGHVLAHRALEDALEPVGSVRRG